MICYTTDVFSHQMKKILLSRISKKLEALDIENKTLVLEQAR